MIDESPLDLRTRIRADEDAHLVALLRGGRRALARLAPEATPDLHEHRWCRETGSSAEICLDCGSVLDHGVIKAAASLRDLLEMMKAGCTCEHPTMRLSDFGLYDTDALRDVDAEVRMRELGFPDYDYLP